MHKEALYIAGTQLSSADTNTCDLLVQSGEDFTGFVLYRQATKQVYAWLLYDELIATPAVMQSIVQEYSWLANNYKKTAIVHYANVNMLVPAVFNIDSEKELLFDLAGSSTKGRLLSKDLILQQNIMNHYSISEESAFLLNQQFPKGYWWHDQSLLLSKPASEDAQITVTIWFKTIQITIEQNVNWSFLQKFTYKTPEDVLYHVLNCAKQYQVNLDETPVLVEGFIEQSSKLGETLQMYIPDLRWKDELQFQFPPSAYQPHLLASLDRILTCVL
jgi:hypothetical protein